MPGSISPLVQALRPFKIELSQARGAVVNRQAVTAGPTVPDAVALQVTSNALQALRTQVRAARGAEGKLPPGKALRVFVQAALVDELDTELQVDPALSDLVERTCQARSERPAMALHRVRRAGARRGASSVPPRFEPRGQANVLWARSACTRLPRDH